MIDEQRRFNQKRHSSGEKRLKRHIIKDREWQESLLFGGFYELE